MWIVVVVQSHYPSVFHFDEEGEARESYDQSKEYGHVVHLAKVLDSDYCYDFKNIDKEDIKTLDVDWA